MNKNTKKIPCMRCDNLVEVSIYTHRIYCKVCREKQHSSNTSLKASHKYRHTKKGKEAKKRDESSIFGRVRVSNYLHSEQGWNKLRQRALRYAKQQRKLKRKQRYLHQQGVLASVESFFKASVVREATFYDLVDNISGKHLRVDGFIDRSAKQRGIIVEVHGAQHYMPIRFGGISEKRAIDNLITYQRRDRIKQQFCIDKGYMYLCIPYNVPIDMVYDFLRETLKRKVKVASISKEFNFAYSHRLNNELISDIDNKYIFRKCNNFNGHGHNMKMFVEVQGFIDPLTGMVINFDELKRIVRESVLDKYDHKSLTDDLGLLLSTCENTLEEIWSDLIIELPNLLSITLYETPTSRAVLTRADVQRSSLKCEDKNE